MNKFHLRGVAAAALLVVATAASAETCQQRANNCVGKGGKPADCHDPQRLAQCKRTGQYTAPSGTVWQATAENTDPARKRK
jgi:hypothetical protein